MKSSRKNRSFWFCSIGPVAADAVRSTASRLSSRRRAFSLGRLLLEGALELGHALPHTHLLGPRLPSGCDPTDVGGQKLPHGPGARRPVLRAHCQRPRRTCLSPSRRVMRLESKCSSRACAYWRLVASRPAARRSSRSPSRSQISTTVAGGSRKRQRVVVEAGLDPHQALLQRQRLEQLAQPRRPPRSISPASASRSRGSRKSASQRGQQALRAGVVTDGARRQEARATRNRLARLARVRPAGPTHAGSERSAASARAPRLAGRFLPSCSQRADQPRARALELCRGRSSAVAARRSAPPGRTRAAAPAAQAPRPGRRAPTASGRAEPRAAKAHRRSRAAAGAPTRSGPAPCLRGAGSTTQPPPIVSGGATCRSTNRSPRAGTIGRSSLS